MFGFVYYKHVPDATRRRLDERSNVMLLIGHRFIDAYKLYCPITNKIVFNRDEIVKESDT